MRSLILDYEKLRELSSVIVETGASKDDIRKFKNSLKANFNRKIEESLDPNIVYEEFQFLIRSSNHHNKTEEELLKAFHKELELCTEQIEHQPEQEIVTLKTKVKQIIRVLVAWIKP